MGYELDSKAFEEVLEAFKDKVEQLGPIINDVLWNEGASEIKKEIRLLIPISDRRKRHAAESQPFTQGNENLAVTVKTTGRWGYLVFPDEGRGSHNPTPQEFMLRGGEAATENIVSVLEARMTEELNK